MVCFVVVKLESPSHIAALSVRFARFEGRSAIVTEGSRRARLLVRLGGLN